MKKLIVAAVAVVVVAGAGGGWYVLRHRGDPVETAKNLLKQGDVRAAGIQLRVAVRDQPSNPEAHAMLSQVQLLQGDPVAAEKEIKAAEALGWHKDQALNILAQSYFAQSKWKEILAEVPKSGETPDQTAQFLMTRAMAERGLGDVAASKADITLAENAAPKNPQVWLAASRIAVSDKDKPEAVKTVDQALALDAKSVDALQLKAQLLMSDGNRADAVRLYDQAIELAPKNGALRVERATQLLAMGQTEKALADVDTVPAKDPAEPIANYIKMVALVRQGKFTEADQVEQKMDTVINRFQRGLYFKAMIKASIGQVETAQDAIKNYVARNGQDADGIRLLGRIALAIRRPQEAIPALRNAIAAGMGDPAMLDLLGRAYALDGNRGAAESAFQQASAGDKTSPAELTRLASSRMQIGDLSGAATDLQRSLDIAPDTPGAGEALVATAIGLGDLDRAQAALDKLRAQKGDTESVGLLDGLIKQARFDAAGALESFRATAQKFPNSVRARIDEAKLLVQTGKLQEAEAPLQQILAKNPANTEALALIVQVYMAEKKGPQAIAAAEAARAAAPSQLGILSGEAELYVRLGDVNKALAVLDAAKVDGNTPAALLPELIRVQIAAGQQDAAKASMAALVRAEPANLSARIAQIEVLARLKDLNGARDAAQAALQRSPGDLRIMSLMLTIEATDKGADAAIALADKLRADPANMPAAAVLKGDAYMNQRRFGDAIGAYSAEFKLEPSSILVLRLASALQASGDPNKALAELKTWQASHPADADTALFLASLEITQHQYGPAERDLQTVLASRPNDSAALNNLAWLMQQKGDKGARIYAQRSYMQNQSPESADTLGWIMVSQGEAARALPLLERAVVGRPDSLSLKYHLAVALKDLGRVDDAVNILKPLTDPAATFDEKPAAQQLLASLSKPK